MTADGFEPICGCMGCREPKVDIVHVPGKGPRAVYEFHKEDLEVNGGAE